MQQRELVEQARAGDETAFCSLARTSMDRFYAVALRITNDPDLAQDAVQQALISIWRDLPLLRDADRFDSWSYRLLVRRSIRLTVRERQERTAVSLPGSAPVAGDAQDGVAERDEMDHAFRQLSAEHRAVLVLRFYLDQSLHGIAEILGIPEGTVASRLHHATRRLSRALARERSWPASLERTR
jgi:RNA polymerase sigma-70 factor (ECF subfamily)